MDILIVEDEVDLGASLAEGLRAEGYRVGLVHDGASALSRLAEFPVRIVILDRNLPVLDGDTVCRTLTAMGHPARVLMLTASGSLEDRVTGLNLGADDYLAKPFAYAELIARVRALNRRIDDGPEVRDFGDVRVNLSGRGVTRAGQHIRLSPKEYGVMHALALAPGTVSFEDLVDEVWAGEDREISRGAVKAVVYALRQKLGTPDVILTETGRGYRLVAPSEARPR
ncbi:response regulator transcription factor [Mycetocola spongiae]|uniref:response regulator transcription factor n=1 Tax=Mycetocola spongiae TaxID=2859226 RepID=UPI001CF5A901|nr:response regulator transcription factor [Mycetocola spongiae]UCR87879.1 response regulator transcription factor [Mycetocola spongiae]